MSWTMHCLYHFYDSGRHEGTPGELFIDDQGLILRADPVIWMSGQLLSELHLGTPEFAELTCSLGCKLTQAAMRKKKLADFPIKTMSWGDKIRITSADSTAYVYIVRQLIKFDPQVWEASWPD